MRLFLQLAAILLLTGAATTHAQITNPDKLIAPAPRNPARAPQQPTDDLQWLWQYTRPAPMGDKSALLADPRFIRLMKDHLKTPQAFWGNQVPLSDAAMTFLGGSGEVSAINNRYLVISGCVIEQCAQRGLLWIDLGAQTPLIIFAALRWTEQSNAPSQPDAPFELWLFPSRDLDLSFLPEALRTSLAAWIYPKDPCAALSPRIGPGIVVDQDGTPHMRPPGILYDNIVCTTTSDPVTTKQRKNEHI